MKRKEQRPYMPWFVRDFNDDPKVKMARWLDRAVYRVMLEVSWEIGPLPDDPSMIGRLIGAQQLQGEFYAMTGDVGDPWDVDEIIRWVLEEFWMRDPDSVGWINPRLEHERAYADGLKEAQRKRTQAARDAALAARQKQLQTSDSLCDRPSNRLQVQVQVQDQENKNTPPSPLPGGVSARAKKKPTWTGTIPGRLQTPEFEAAWKDWLAYRREEKRQPVTQRSGDMALRQLEEWGPKRAVAAIQHTIAMGWQGLREPEAPRTNGRANGFHRNGADMTDDEWRRFESRLGRGE